MKKSISLIVCLLSVLWMQAQSPGGVSGASLWLKADSGASGVTYFNVPSANRTASSNFAGLGPANSTLTSTSSWSAATNTTGDFLTLDLGSAQTVRGVVTRGRGDAAQWVTAYTVSYSTDNVSYISLGSFSGNTDQNTEVINLFPSSVNARYVRFTVNAVSGYPSMRADVIQSVSPVSDNTAVTAWIDSSPSGNNVSQGENTFRPVYRNSSTDNINFNPVVQFNGSSQRMDAASFAINPATATLFSVATANNITGNIRTIMASHSTSDANHHVRMNIENAQLRFFKSVVTASSETANSTNLFAPAVPFVYSINASQPGNNTTVLYNGLVQVSSANTLFPNTVNRFTLGCAGVSAFQFWNGSIPEAIVYNGMILNAGQRNRIESYLALKYGATLGTTASPVSYLASDGLTTFWTADATYQNNIAGIGLDNGSALHQKQSRSQNTGSQVVVSLGTIAADNLTNGGTVATDRQFFVWGDNNGLLTTFVPTGNTTYPNRFERIWKTQNTGSFAQNITVYYPVSAFGNASSNTIALLHGSSAASLNSGPAAIAQSGTTTINGVSHYIFTVPAAAIANMQFFSFSALQSAPGGVFTGLGAWWKADFSASGSAWADASGNGRNATLASGTITYNANGGTAANFNPQLTTTDGYMSYTNPVYPSTANYDNMNVFAAIQPLSGQNCIPWGEAANNGQSAALFHFNNNDAYFDAPFGYRATSGFIANGGNYGVSNILEGWKNGTSMRLHLQTRQIATFATAGGNFFSNTNNANYLFAYPGQVTSGGAGVSEVFAYNTPLSTTDRARVNSYLGIKYGITLDQTTPQNYISSVGSSIWDAATANLGYNNNIAGIGRDDASALLQKQSRSVNSGIQPVIGNGNTIMAANAANGSSFTNNLSFLVWGSNANPATFTTAINYSGLNRLMERIWKVQETGTVGSVRVALRSSDLPFNISNPALIVSSDAAINSSDNIIPMIQAVLGGVSYWYADINLNNGEFFTFGGVLASPGGVSTGLQLWLKADTGLNGSQWPDSSGNRTVSTGSGTPALQTGNINFNNSILFNNAAMTVSGTFTQNSHYAFTVANSPITASAFRVFLGCRQLSSSGTPYPYYMGRQGASDISYVTAFQDGTAIGRVSGSVSQTTNIHHSLLSAANGLAHGFNGVFTTSTPHTAPHTFEHVLGSNRFNTGGYVTLSPDVNIGEVVVYNGAILADVEQNRILSYLSVKYGTTLGTTVAPVSYLASNGLTTIWAADAIYQNNIGGIGRDNLSALHQKQSRSQNTGSQVVVSLGTIAADNQANSGTLTNGQFFIWGDNNGLLTTFVPTGNTSYPNRFARIWKTQNTGSFAQNITVYYPVSAFGNAAAGTIALLYGASAASLDSGPSAIAQSGTTTINGVSHYIFTVPAAQVANMQFFSFSALQASPGGVTGASLWLKADAGTSSVTDGTGISSWQDQSGVANNATQGTASSQPVYRNNTTDNINFNPVVNFDGTNHLMNLNLSLLPTGTTARSLFATYFYNGTNSAANQIISWGGTSTVTGSVYGMRANSLNMDWGNIPQFATPSANALRIASNIWQGSGNASRIWSSSSLVAGPTNITANTSNTGTARLGANNWSGLDNERFGGRLPEVIVYPSALNDTQRLQVESYLAIKYGATLGTTASPVSYLASDGSTVWAGDTTYQNNIAGIGRDNLSALHQKQSRSQNAGSQVVVSLGTVAATNQDNAGSLANGQFFIWGDDNGSLSNFVSTGNAAYPNRFTRIWKTQNTGSFAQNITVYYPVSAFGNASAITIALLYGTSAASLSNGTAAAITQSGTTTINGVSHYIFTVPAAQVANMQFFSFSAVQASPGGVTGASLWLKADTGVSNTSGNVTAWQDLTNTNNFTITGVPVTNTNQLNFNNVVTFDGNDFLTGNTAISFKNGYGVYDFTNGSATFTNTLLSGTIPNFSNESYFFKGQRMAAGDNSADGGLTFVRTASDIGFNPLIANMDIVAGQPASSTLAFLNGGRLSTQLFSGSGNMSNHNSIPYIGRSSANSEPDRFTGDLGEMIMYPVTHTSLQRLQINTYLAVKYGITLSRDNDGDAVPGEVISGGILEGDYVASDGTTRIWNSDAAYQNNVAGIGRDDASALVQRVSRSVESGSILTLATNNNFVLANTDVSRTGITNNLSFLVIGNNNGSATARAATNLASGFNTRIARLWKVQATNYTQAVSMQFSGLDHANFTWNVVWKSSDDNFTTGSTTLGTLNNSGQITLPAGLASGYLSLQSAALDSDGDSVIDFDDLDDDNDGILDINESSNASVQIAGTGNQIINGVTLSKVLGTGITANIASLGSTCSTAMVSSSGYRFQTTTSTALTFNFSSPVSGNIDVVMNSVYLDEIFTVTSTGGPVSVSTLGTGTCVTVSGNTYRGVSGSSSINDSGSVRLSFNTPVTSITITATGPDLLSFHDFFLNTVIDIDTDNDGIPNRLDLDSDNDGCVDAIEGAAGITPSQLVTASGTVTVGTGSTASNQNLGTSVNAQGVPQFAILPSGYSNTTGQALGTSQTVNTVVVGTASSNQTISANTAPAALALTGSTGGTGFQWQVSSDNIAFTDIPAATSATYSPGTLTATRYYRVNVTSPGGCVFTSNTVTITVNAFCYKPAATVGTTLDAKQGITALGRAGTNNENWPMVRKGAWTVLEAKTKGFVINRLTAAQIAAIPPANLVEGMMVYDTTASCMKVYTSTDGGTTFGWQCITTQTCPD